MLSLLCEEDGSHRAGRRRQGRHPAVGEVGPVAEVEGAGQEGGHP